MRNNVEVLAAGVDSMSIVYSTGQGRMCPGCRRPVAQCVCKTAAGKAVRADAGKVRVSRQTQSRAGKAVTVITGLSLGPVELETLARELKRHCGSGSRRKFKRNGKSKRDPEHGAQSVRHGRTDRHHRRHRTHFCRGSGDCRH